MKPAFELPDDWFVENDGQRLVLDPEKVKAAFEARVALQGWQPIESAPKDGTQILLWYPWTGIITKGEGAPDGFMYLARWSFNEDGSEGWIDPTDDDSIGDGATHWQPLPQPPAASDREERCSPPKEKL